MSYILDALRKADAERETGLATEAPTAMPSAPAGALPRTQRPARVWAWLAAGAAIPLAALLAWRLLVPDGAPEPAPRVAMAPRGGAAPTASEAAAVPTASATAATPTAAPEAPAQAASAPVGGAEPPEPAASPVPAAEAPPQAVAEPAPPPVAKAAAPARAPAAPKKPPTKPREAKATEPPKPSTAPVRPLAELPEDLRRQVPAMTLGGSVYAPQPENRMLVVNGQVVREGTELAPGLRLESIGRQSAVFSIRGQRFEMRL